MFYNIKNMPHIFILIMSFVALGQTKILNEKDVVNSILVHNQERKLLGIENLEWSSELQEEAELYAKYLAETNSFEHSKVKNQGENLYFEFNSESITDKPFQRASQAWLDEKEDYTYSKISNKRSSEITGHYTQMVWRKTTKIGIGSYVNSKGELYVVARYFPAGNYIDEYPY
jgi:pathogenesis-related protein 1